MSRGKFTAEEKVSIVLEYLDKHISTTKLARKYHVSETSIKRWIKGFKGMGIDAFSEGKNKSYTNSLKVIAVTDYLAGKGSLSNICQKYNIRSTTQLRTWIKKYNGHEELKSTGSGGIIMTKGRKTTLEERIEIVSYCIENNHNYNQTAEKFKVSYQQARNFVKKYEARGVDGLQDRRGKRKPEEEMTELEKLRAEIKMLKAQHRRDEMKIDFLKKLREVERRWGLD